MMESDIVFPPGVYLFNGHDARYSDSGSTFCSCHCAFANCTDVIRFNCGIEFFSSAIRCGGYGIVFDPRYSS